MKGEIKISEILVSPINFLKKFLFWSIPPKRFFWCGFIVCFDMNKCFTSCLNYKESFSHVNMYLHTFNNICEIELFASYEFIVFVRFINLDEMDEEGCVLAPGGFGFGGTLPSYSLDEEYDPLIRIYNEVNDCLEE
jgi:hypothetical protein